MEPDKAICNDVFKNYVTAYDVIVRAGRTASPRLRDMANLFRDYPELRRFQFQNVRLTGTRIGSGAYGSVEEGEIPGARCAIKRIHDIFQDRSEIPQADMAKAAGQFVEECRLMSADS